MTAAEIHEPLKVRQVKGSSAAVCEINSERERSIREASESLYDDLRK